MAHRSLSLAGVRQLGIWILGLLLPLALFSTAAASEKLERFDKVFATPETTRLYFQKYATSSSVKSAWSGPSYSSKLDDEFADLLRWYANQNSQVIKDRVIQNLQEIRNELPLQLRWLLSAFEIHIGKYSELSLRDAQSALKHTEIVESFSLDLGVFFTRGSKALIYRDFGGGRIRIFSGKELLFVQSAWQQLPRLSESFAAQSFGDPVYEASRVSWMRVLAKLEMELDISSIRNAVEVMNHPKILRFQSYEQKENFLESSLSLLFNLYAQYRRSSEFSDGKLVTSRSGIEHYKLLADIIRQWVLADLDFVVKNYDRLNRRGLLKATDVVLRQLNSNELSLVLEYLEKKRKLPVDSYLIAAMLWANSQSKNSESDLNKLTSKTIINVLFEASPSEYGVKIGQFGFETQLLSQLEYRNLLNLFFDLYNGRLTLSKDQALRLFEIRTPRPASVSEKDWYDFEWKRLLSVQNALPREEFKAKLVQKLFSSEALSERLLVARFLRLQMKASDLEELSRQLKIKAQNVNEKKFKQAQYQDWVSKNGELIALINALNPQDAELRSFLTRVYSNREVSGPLAGQSALLLLAEAGIASEQVREEILRRLQFVSAGDSAGSFKAFIKLFPEDAANIVAIIHRHRVVPQKLSLMLVHLVNQADENPQLLESVILGLQRQADRAAASALYQGLTLDKWLQQKLAQKSVIANQKVIVCSEIFGD